MELGPIVKSKKTLPSLFIRLLALSWPSCSRDCLVCAALIIHKRKGEREREGGERGTRIPQFLPCKHDPVLSSISPAPLFSFICPSSSASLGGLRNWPGIDISGPSRAQNPSCTTAFSLARFLRSPPSFHPIHLLPPSNHRLAGIP